MQNESAPGARGPVFCGVDMGGPRLMEELPSVRAEGALGAALGALADLWAAALLAPGDFSR